MDKGCSLGPFLATTPFNDHLLFVARAFPLEHASEALSDTLVVVGPDGLLVVKPHSSKSGVHPKDKFVRWATTRIEKKAIQYVVYEQEEGSHE